MISIAYVNGVQEPLLLSDPEIKLESVIEGLIKESDDAYNTYINKYNKYITEAEIIGEISEAKQEELIIESSNVFEKIGESLIRMAEKIKEVISNMLDRIRGFYKKTDLEKINEAAKKNPAIADDLVKAFQRGDLTVYDAKSIKDIENAYMELIKYAKDKNVSPDSLEGRIKLFKKKCEEADKSGLTTVAKAVGTIVGSAATILGIRKIFSDTTKSVADSNISQGKVFDQACDAIHMLSQSSNADIKKAMSGELGKSKMIEEVSRYTGMKLQGMASHNTNVLDKIGGILNSLLVKIDKSGKIAAKMNAKDVEQGKELVKIAETRWNIKNPKVDRGAELLKIKQDSKARTIGQKEGELTFNQKHKKQLASATYNTAKAQKNAQIDADNAHYATHKMDILQREMDKANVQAQGRELGSTKPVNNTKKFKHTK